MIPDGTQYNIEILFTRLSEGYYEVTPTGGAGGFSGVTCPANICNFVDLPIVFGVVTEKTDNYIRMYLNDDTYDGTVLESFYIYQSSGHATDCRDYIVAETSGIIDAGDIKTFTQVPYWARYICKYGSFEILTRSMEGLDDAENEGNGEWFDNEDLGICWAHGENSHVELTDTTRLDLISAIGAGNNAGNQKSYGAGLEYYLNCEAYGCDVAESWATAIIGGMIGKLMTNHPTWNFHDARQALRQSASNWATGWIADGGFGAVDYDVANAIADEDLLCMSPFYQEITVNASSVDFVWVNSPQGIFNKTVIARFDSEPGRTDTPTADEIIYEGTDESFNYKYYGNAGTFWFVFYSVNDEGNYSRIESYDVSEKVINQSEYVNKLLRAKTHSTQYLDLSPTYIPFIIQCLNNGVKTNPDSINLYIYENIGTITSAFSSAFGEGFDRNLALAPTVFDSIDYGAFDDAFDSGFGGGVRQINEKTGFYGIFVPKNLLSANKQYQAYWEYEIDGKSMGKHEIFNTYNSESFYG